MTTDRYDQDLLLDYVEGELPHDAAARVEAMLRDDARLAALVADLRAHRAGLRQLPPAEPPGDLTDGVMQYLERSMLLGPPDAPHPTSSPPADAPRRRRLGPILVYSGLAALLVLCTAGVVLTLSDPGLSRWADRFGGVAIAPPPADRDVAAESAAPAGPTAVPPTVAAPAEALPEALPDALANAAPRRRAAEPEAGAPAMTVPAAPAAPVESLADAEPAEIIPADPAPAPAEGEAALARANRAADVGQPESLDDTLRATSAERARFGRAIEPPLESLAPGSRLRLRVKAPEPALAAQTLALERGLPAAPGQTTVELRVNPAELRPLLAQLDAPPGQTARLVTVTPPDPAAALPGFLAARDTADTPTEADAEDLTADPMPPLARALGRRPAERAEPGPAPTAPSQAEPFSPSLSLLPPTAPEAERAEPTASAKADPALPPEPRWYALLESHAPVVPTRRIAPAEATPADTLPLELGTPLAPGTVGRPMADPRLTVTIEFVTLAEPDANTPAPDPAPDKPEPSAEPEPTPSTPGPANTGAAPPATDPGPDATADPALANPEPDGRDTPMRD